MLKKGRKIQSHAINYKATFGISEKKGHNLPERTAKGIIHTASNIQTLRA